VPALVFCAPSNFGPSPYPSNQARKAASIAHTGRWIMQLPQRAATTGLCLLRTSVYNMIQARLLPSILQATYADRDGRTDPAGQAGPVWMTMETAQYFPECRQHPKAKSSRSTYSNGSTTKSPVVGTAAKPGIWWHHLSIGASAGLALPAWCPALLVS
jgi:hypothetical protein